MSQDDSSYQSSDYSEEVGSVDDDVDDSAGDGSLSDENDNDDDNDDDPNHMIHMDPDDDVTSSEGTTISQHSEDIQDEDDEDDEDSHALPSQQTGVGLMPSTVDPGIVEGLASETTGVDEPWDNPTVEVDAQEWMIHQWQASPNNLPKKRNLLRQLQSGKLMP